MRINLSGLTDRAVAEELAGQMGDAIARARSLAVEVQGTVEEVLNL